MTTTSLQAKKAAHISWANTINWTARTDNARKAFEQRWLKLADGDPKRAASMRKAFYADLAMKSAASRKRRKGAA